MSQPRHLFLIAGEASGDRLGADLMDGLIAELGQNVRFSGVGGPLMQARGLESLFPMDRLSVMGLTEILPRVPELLRLIRQTAEAVEHAAPDALITIDSPDFCLRVARKVRRVRPDLRTIHYVAPSVWAWRPGRAAKMAKVIDHVLALLPFEPPYMTAAGMTCDFVGHPVVEVPPAPKAALDDLRRELDLGEGPLLCLLPGSRAGEVARHGALFAEVWARLHAQVPGLKGVIPTVPARAEAVQALFADAPGAPLILAEGDDQKKRAAFALADAALAVSGTVTLEVAAAGTPMVVAYRTSALSAFLARRLVKVRYASLVNILEDAPVIPEYLFDAASASALEGEVLGLLTSPDARQAQSARFSRVMEQLGRGGLPPGQRAARSVLSRI
ncbi:lipid-A-disaccharide synthase [Oceanibium sediminis]|uniref:lipid-A-disaccharide synthase n=1 Tax=Oceanibium sediminis TaxID=2026339 RepID=UPI0021583EF0|nr:lipid-A-disaccharide synthase [Oceanibium sediminis]